MAGLTALQTGYDQLNPGSSFGQSSAVGAPSQQQSSGPQSTPFGPLPQVTPTYTDPSQSQSYLDQYMAALQTAMAPTNQQQMQQLDASNAARGITNSGAASQLEGNLLGQQSAALASADSPMISQAFGNTQQDVLANQMYANQSANTNVGMYYNSMFAPEVQAYLGSFGPNSGIQSMQNTGLSAQTGAYTNAYDQAMQQQDAGLSALGSAAGMAFGMPGGGGGGTDYNAYGYGEEGIPSSGPGSGTPV